MPRGTMTRTETKGERKRTTTTKQNARNSSYVVQEVTPQILSLGTKPFLIFKKWFNRFFRCSRMKSNFYCQLQLRTLARKFSNIDFFLQILSLKGDELVMSEM